MVFFLFIPRLKHLVFLATLKSCDTMKQSVNDNIYAPHGEGRTFVKELTVTTCVIHRYSNELNTLIADRVKFKPTKVNSYALNSRADIVSHTGLGGMSSAWR